MDYLTQNAASSVDDQPAFWQWEMIGRKHHRSGLRLHRLHFIYFFWEGKKKKNYEHPLFMYVMKDIGLTVFS